METKRVIVVGGGAAGMMAAISAAREGHAVTLLEQNEKLGKKIYITGKGRCNLTNACSRETFFSNVVSNPKFLYSALGTFDSASMTAFLEAEGLRLKTERGGRVFPASDKASDVTRTLTRALERLGVSVRLGTRVTGLLVRDGICRGVRAEAAGAAEELAADAVILATGGLSYPSTGSTGDGHRMAREAGHRVTPCLPALVPLTGELPCGADWRQLQGLSLRNVAVTVLERPDGKTLFREQGELLFTHFGVSGPLILTVSSRFTACLSAGERLWLLIDTKPALSEAVLDARLLREFEASRNAAVKTVLKTLLPQSMTGPVLLQARIDPDRPVHEVTREERRRLLRALKGFPVILTGTRGFSEAVITQGGVSTREVEPKTMRSRLLPGLSFAGELLDVDALTGGFNLQIAWSTGVLAGKGIS